MLEKYFKKMFLVVFVSVFCLLLGYVKAPQCNQSQIPDLLTREFNDQEEKISIYDPFEDLNRIIFGFNKGFSDWLLSPIADFYGIITPDFVQTGIGNFFYNLKFPVRAAGDILQLNGEKLRRDSFFFVVNTVSSLGFFDFRSDDEKARDSENISQSLAYWGIPPGPYIVWPFLGPSNIRDTFGMLFDMSLSPTSYLGYPDSTIAEGTEIVHYYYKRDRAIIETIYDASLDPYTGAKKGYEEIFQKRLAQ